ncbi:MAG: glycoside hydrolase family 3 C-terminal domain-containing protein [Endomicrobium sp.]|jgi:beta-glucosidase|nr:glycoside hydrolase family 3 C-terminal domain-containing protein [Endomicrobium sp.]
MFDFNEKAKEIVSKMTLEEKVSQMTHDSAALERFGIPAYNWWNEALHGIARSGTATVFPQSIALAATFDADLIEKTADIISTEGRAKFNAYQEFGDVDMYKGITFWSPNINIFRDPRWGRGHETYGEDPYLTSIIGAAFIRGLQGKDKNNLKTAACVKHFALHSGPENDRHHFNAVVDKYDLWNTYLAAFEYAVKETAVEGVMGAYNSLYGQACCGSEFLLKDILRHKWGFDGYVVSDYNAIQNIHENHKITKNAKESAALAINAGCDLEAGNTFASAVQAAREGLIKEERIDEAVRRLIVTRMRLGIFDSENKSQYCSISYKTVDCAEHKVFNLEVAKRSVIMLKNNGVLPLDASKFKTVGVIGPNAHSRRALEGNYNGTASQYITVLDGIRKIISESGAQVLFAEGGCLFKDSKEDLTKNNDCLAEAYTVAKISDVNIVCLGLDGDIEGEEDETPGKTLVRGDKQNINLPQTQQRLLKTVIKASRGKPVIVAVISGSALDLSFADKHADGIFQSFYPGALGGMAIAEAIFGKFSPSAKLPVTFYKKTEDLPAFDDYNMKGRTYRYFKGEVLYPFGFGLGYSKFHISDLKADDKSCAVKVKNTGSFDAFETLQAYIISPGQKEIRNLCGARPVFLKTGEEKEVKITFSKTAFSRYNDNGDLYKIKGEHILTAGFTQPDKQSIKLYGQTPLVTIIKI